MRHIFTPSLLLISVLVSAQNYSFSPTFGNGGLITVPVTPNSETAVQHALCPDGKILLAGGGYDSGSNSFHASFVRLDPTCATLDTTLGGVGSIDRIFEQRTLLQGVAVQPDGHIVGCGMIAPSNNGGDQWPGVFRLSPNGDPDPTFNGTGYHRLLFDGSIGTFSEVFVSADSTITCTGSGEGRIGAFRFRHDGSLDTTFGNDGAATLLLPNYYTAVGCGLLLPDSSVIAFDLMYNGLGQERVIVMAKFDHAGVPDAGFGVGGLVITSVQGSPQVGQPGTSLHAELQADGKIIVSSIGGGDLNCSMARFLENGDPDMSFGTNGISLVIVPDHKGEGMVILPDGSTLQFGTNGPNGILVKRDADGQVVSSFGTNGIVTTSIGDPNGQKINSAVLLPDGHLIGYGRSHIFLFACELTTDPGADALPVITQSGTDLITSGTGDFQWFLGGSPIAGANTNSISPTQNGDYTVRLTVSPDCIFTSPIYALLNVGLDVHNANHLHLLQNPVTDVLNITNAGARVNCELLDMNGRTLRSTTIASGMNTWDVGALATGIYALRLYGDGMERTIRFVKQ